MQKTFTGGTLKFKKCKGHEEEMNKSRERFESIQRAAMVCPDCGRKPRQAGGRGGPKWQTYFPLPNVTFLGSGEGAPPGLLKAAFVLVLTQWGESSWVFSC